MFLRRQVVDREGEEGEVSRCYWSSDDRTRLIQNGNAQSLNSLKGRWIQLTDILLASKWIHLGDPLLMLPCSKEELLIELGLMLTSAKSLKSGSRS